MASGGIFKCICCPCYCVSALCCKKDGALRGGAGNKKVVHNNVTYFQAGHVLYDDAGTAVGNIDRKGVITMNYVEANRVETQMNLRQSSAYVATV